MAAGSLPAEGELRLGPVSLPAGKWLLGGWEAAEPVAWITRENVPDTGQAWAALSAALPETGLVPILLGGLPMDGAPLLDADELSLIDVTQLSPMEAASLGLPGSPLRPWDLDEFGPPADISGLSHLDSAALLRDLWAGWTESAGEGDEDDYHRAYFRQAIAPFSREFPGLAPPGEEPLSEPELRRVLGSLPDARIGLVPADRPADVLPLIGWFGTANRFGDALPVAAVLRSWEDRFGARLLQAGFAWIRVLVDRPPRTLAHAERIAAEHYAFCDECGGRGLREISAIAASLLESPIWTFWWD